MRLFSSGEWRLRVGRRIVCTSRFLGNSGRTDFSLPSLMVTVSEKFFVPQVLKSVPPAMMPDKQALAMMLLERAIYIFFAYGVFGGLNDLDFTEFQDLPNEAATPTRVIGQYWSPFVLVEAR
jgi:hypothetical protein